ncbi:MAG TPA: hypothetical protein VNB94_01105 [Mycobacteriales bacterium]|nr:hypothetical protein [Mycobacteriales bacterium]
MSSSAAALRPVEFDRYGQADQDSGVSGIRARLDSDDQHVKRTAALRAHDLLVSYLADGQDEDAFYIVLACVLTEIHGRMGETAHLLRSLVRVAATGTWNAGADDATTGNVLDHLNRLFAEMDSADR